MQTLETKTKKTSVETSAAKAPASRSARAFFMALAVFGLLNVVLLTTGIGHQKRNPAEILEQAKQEQSSGIESQHSWPWWLGKLYLEQTQAPDVVIFGSSLLGSAHASVDANFLFKTIDVVTHRNVAFLEDQLNKRLGQKVSVFSLGSPGEMISDYYITSKAMFATGKKPKMVIATIAPRDFVDSTLAYPGATDHYKFFSNYVDVNDLNNAAYPDAFARLGAEIERMPLKHLSRLKISEHAESPKTTWSQVDTCRIEPGKSVVPAGTIPKQVDNTQEYVERFRRPGGPNYANEMKFFKRWLSELKDQGIAVVVICMPTTAANRQLLPAAFWQRFRADVSSVCKSNNADYFDLSDSGLFQQSDYLDTVHLNAYGAVRLFPVIAERVSMNNVAVRALKK